MKYIYITGTEHDEEVTESNNKEELIEMAKRDWSHMNDEDKKRTVNHYVIESINPDEDAENHFDGDIVYCARG